MQLWSSCEQMFCQKHLAFAPLCLTWKLVVLKNTPKGLMLARLLPNHSLTAGWEMLMGTGRLMPPSSEDLPGLFFSWLLSISPESSRSTLVSSFNITSIYRLNKRVDREKKARTVRNITNKISLPAALAWPDCLLGY